MSGLQKDIQSENVVNKQLPVTTDSVLYLIEINVLSKVNPEIMMEVHEREIELSMVTQYIKVGKMPRMAQIAQITSRNVHKYLLQFD